jgi:hypothetical protein
MAGWTFVHSSSSPPVSKAPRSRPYLSTTTKMVLWMNKSSESVRSSGFFSTAVSLRLSIPKAAICFGPAAVPTIAQPQNGRYFLGRRRVEFGVGKSVTSLARLGGKRLGATASV